MAAHGSNRPAVSAARSWRLPGLLLAATLLAAPVAAADEQTELRLTVTLLTLDMSQTACGFRPIQPRVAAMLSSANVTRDQLYSRPLTPGLQVTIGRLRDSFIRDANATCAQTWRDYGPASTLSLLSR